MGQISEIQKADAMRILPPAAHRAKRFQREIGDLVPEIGQLDADLKALIESCPHDKAEILRLVECFKRKAMTIHGQAVRACQDIKDGR